MDYSKLSSLGFSKLTVDCYRRLFVHGPAKISQLEQYLRRPQSSIYPCLNKLVKLGFINKTKVVSMGPAYFYAIPLDEALDNLADYYRAELKDLIKQQRRYIRRLSC